MKTYTIKQKMSNTGEHTRYSKRCWGQDYKICPNCKFAVVLASYYGGKGYSTHRTEATAISASGKLKDYSHNIIDKGYLTTNFN